MWKWPEWKPFLSSPVTFGNYIKRCFRKSTKQKKRGLFQKGKRKGSFSDLWLNGFSGARVRVTIPEEAKMLRHPHYSWTMLQTPWEDMCDSGIILLTELDLNLEHCRGKKSKAQQHSPSLIMLTFLHCIKTAHNLNLDKKLPIHFQNTHAKPPKTGWRFHCWSFTWSWTLSSTAYILISKIIRIGWSRTRSLQCLITTYYWLGCCLKKPVIPEFFTFMQNFVTTSKL